MTTAHITKLTVENVRRTSGGARARTHVRAGIEMQKNDTTIAGDKYQTDTCHVDNYGTTTMT